MAISSSIASISSSSPICQYATGRAEKPFRDTRWRRRGRSDRPPVGHCVPDRLVTGTNAPVRAGEDLVVEAAVEPEGDSTYHGFVDVEVNLIVGHDPTHVDSETVEVFTGHTETVSLEFTTATVRNTQTFPARVETRDDASVTDVTVIGTEDGGSQGHLEVTGLETNAPVTGGEWLEVTATLSNTGDGPGPVVRSTSSWVTIRRQSTRSR
ncbi:hypothetical protein [Natrinema gari]|uniref:hypothetical protein n=1 Tax=Natrinema gari TaxID=419186 RepID=UPI000A75B2BA|nr:hypothetical protein [Natrinema gari]